MNPTMNNGIEQKKEEQQKENERNKPPYEI